MTNKRFDDNPELPAEISAGWRLDAIRRSERPEDFWRSQQTRIHAHIESRNVRKPRSLWFAVATAALIFFAVLLSAPGGPRPPQATPHARIDADQELLIAVERALAAGTPEALQPLTLLV